MAEAFVELGATAVDHVTDRYFDKGYDRMRKYKNGRVVEDDYDSFDDQRDGRDKESKDRGGRKSSGDRGQYSSPQQASRGVRSSAGGGPRSVTATSAVADGQPSRRRKQSNRLPSPERDIAPSAAAVGTGAAAYTYASAPRDRSLERESITSDRILRDYESERDDPTCRPEKVLSAKQLSWISSNKSRRGSKMTSQYGDGYRESRPRSQPPQSRYDDDGYGSDYDDRTGQRYRGSGRGYDDRDYDVVREETERYRGPVGAGPLVAVSRPQENSRRESYRSGYDDDYAVARYDNRRRSGEETRDRGDRDVGRERRHHNRDRDSRSRSGSRERGGPLEKIGDNFDPSAKGLSAAVAGAVIGGLAGRHFGKQHRERDMLIAGAVGAAVANIGYKKVTDHREREREEEGGYDDRLSPYGNGGGYGRSRSSVR